VEASNEELHLPSKPGMYQLDIVLKKGNNLAIRDRGGMCPFHHIDFFFGPYVLDFPYF